VSCDRFFNHLNQHFPHNKFTMETKKDGIIPFLDVKVLNLTGKLQMKYTARKLTGLHLQYDSNHPKPGKNGIVNILLHCARTHFTLTVAKAREVEFLKFFCKE
jgi:hypothetical protein